ncbi:MAG: pectin acetylesterase-family hydrolase [Myxococcota bacterium]
MLLAAGLLWARPGAAHPMYEVWNSTPYDLETRAPLGPPPAGGNDLFYRWVPLCEDGSGDHEWSETGGASGLAPTCADSEYIRCIDGTRPLYYLDAARDPGSATAYADTDDWVFWFQGGGSCSDTPGGSAADNCWSTYDTASERDEMSSMGKHRAMDVEGILDPDEPTNRFREFNRVQIRKCSYDRFMGRAELLDQPGIAPDPIDLYWHGRRQIEAVFADLDRGADFTPPSGTRTLPSLSDAETVLFAGHSGGSGGVIMNGDWMAEQVQALNPAVRARLLIDARFKPSLENEAHFDTASGWTDIDGSGVIDIWDHIQPSPTSPGALPDNSHYHRGAWLPGATRERQLSQWDADVDDSCEAVNGAWATRCLEEFHVMANYVETPFFLRQALVDQSHVDSYVAHADMQSFGYTEPEFRERVVFQLASFVQGPPPSPVAPGPFRSWPLGIFAPDVAKHAGNTNEAQFFQLGLCEPGSTPTSVPWTYHDALVEWLMHDTEIVAIEDPSSPMGAYYRPSALGGPC